MSLEIDLGKISLVEGLRAALGTAVVVGINQWLNWPLLNFVALGALQACLVDIGGPMRRRVAFIAAFIMGGALLFLGFGVARAGGIWVVLPFACLLLFAHSMLRNWGLNAMQLGNMLSVVMILAIDRVSPWREALPTAAAFAVGGVWALLLTLLLGRVRPYQVAHRAVGEVYRQLATLAEDLKALIDAPKVPADAWDDHARAHRRSVRDAIELARELVHQTFQTRGPQSGVTVQSPIRLEAADEIFGALIGLSSVLESIPSTRPAASRVLRLLVPLLRAIAEAIEHNTDPSSVAIERGIDSIAHIAASETALAGVLGELSGRMHLAVSVAGPVMADMDPADARVVSRSWREDIQDRLIEGLNWQSANFRHALRIMVLGGGAIAATMISGRYYAHWLSITLVLTLQPFFANTRQRAIERGLGTSAGVIGVSLLAMALPTPLVTAAALIPVTVVAFALRRVSFALFISGLTPFVVLLVELGQRDVAAGSIAVQRLVYTLAGVVVAVAGNRFLWPLWEPSRLREQLNAALAAHAVWVMAEKTDDLARRGAGRSSNALESSLARALAEPKATRDRGLELALVADAALRRIGGHLTALALQSKRTPPDWIWRGWIAESLRSMTSGGEPPARPGTELPPGLVPIVRQVELVMGAYGRK